MYWSSIIWSSYDPSYCYGHDEPTISYVSTAPGSGEDARFEVALPADGPTFTVGDFLATVWFGGTVHDVDSLDAQAFLEFQFYPAPPVYTGSNSGVQDCTSDGSFDPAYTPGSNEWFACAIVWQIDENNGGVEDAAFAGPLDSAGSTDAILVMHSNDELWVNYSGIADSSSQGWKISVNDSTDGTGGSVTLVNGGLVLSPEYSTAAAGNTLLWGASNPGAIAFAYEIGHSLNPAIPETGYYGACYPGDGVCDSYWPGEWAQAGQMDLELPVVGSAGATTYPTQIKFSSSQGGEEWINETTYSTCGYPQASTSTNCLYPWYQYRSGSYGFTFDTSNVTNETYNYGAWYQFPSTLNGEGQWNGRTVAAPWGSFATTISPLDAKVDFNRLGETDPLTVAANGTAGGQFEEGPYWFNVSASGCTSISTFVYIKTGASDNIPGSLSCGGHPPLSATAGATPTSGDSPLTVDFTGAGAGGSDSYTYGWAFGDGVTSNLQDPSHTYSSAGSYSAVLTVTDSADSDTAAASVQISVAGAVSASATANVTSGPINLSVRFTGDGSGGTPGYSYLWMFGDGQTSTARDPIHVYTSIGTFVAVLNVTDSKGKYALASVTIHTSAQTSYTVWFNETDLPAGTNWNVSIGSSTVSGSGTSLQFSVFNGSYAYLVRDANSSLRPVAAHGTFRVAGANESIFPVFEAVNFTVSFTATGLPSGSDWSVRLGNEIKTTITSGSAPSTFQFNETNASYPYEVTVPAGLVADPPSGEVGVAGGNISVEVAVSEETYSVTFTAVGLPSEVSWGITVHGVEQNSTTNESVVHASDGTFEFSVVPPGGYSASPAEGNVTVSNANQTVTITFSVVVYAVTFTETGLPNGTSWSLTLLGIVHGVAGTSYSTTLANGSYDYSVSGSGGYSPQTKSGTVHVAGQPMTVTVPFTAPASPSSPSSNPISVTTILIAIAAVGAIAAGTIIYLVGARRRKSPPTPPPAT
jgi:PKD repeat protein